MKIIEIVHVHQLKKHYDIMWHQRYHKHEKNQYELHYFLEGKGSLVIKQKEHPFKKHELFLVLPEIMHAVKSTNSYIAPVSYYAILFELEKNDAEIMHFLQDSNFNNQFPFETSHKNHMVFKTLLTQRMQEKNEFFHRSAEYKLYSFLYELLATHTTPIEKISPVSSKKQAYNHLIDKTITYMQRAIYDNVTITTIALHIGITSEYLIVLFNKHLNTTPLEYYTQLRIEVACAILTNTNMKIFRIAEKFRFSNAQNFTRRFTHIMGISPRKYRNLYLQTAGAGAITSQSYKLGR